MSTRLSWACALPTARRGTYAGRTPLTGVMSRTRVQPGRWKSEKHAAGFMMACRLRFGGLNKEAEIKCKHILFNTHRERNTSWIGTATETRPRTINWARSWPKIPGCRRPDPALPTIRHNRTVKLAHRVSRPMHGKGAAPGTVCRIRRAKLAFPGRHHLRHLLGTRDRTFKIYSEYLYLAHGYITGSMIAMGMDPQEQAPPVGRTNRPRSANQKERR